VDGKKVKKFSRDEREKYYQLMDREIHEGFPSVKTDLAVFWAELRDKYNLHESTYFLKDPYIYRNKESDLSATNDKP